MAAFTESELRILDKLQEAEEKITTLRQQLSESQARADNCQQQAQIWKQEARTQAATVRVIYQELTGRTGEPGDWSGARPLAPSILRKQAEAVELAARESVENAVLSNSAWGHGWIDGRETAVRHMLDYAQRLRQQADEAERAGGEK